MQSKPKFKVGDKVVLVNAELSRFSRIKNGTIITIDGFQDHFSDGPLLSFKGELHPELSEGIYLVRADCVISEELYNSPLYQALT